MTWRPTSKLARPPSPWSSPRSRIHCRFPCLWHHMTSMLPRFAKTHAEWPENPDLLKPRPCRSARPQGLLLLGAMGSHGLSWFIMMWTWCFIVFSYVFHIFPILNSIWLEKIEDPRALEPSLKDRIASWRSSWSKPPWIATTCRVALMDLVTRFNYDDLWLYL